MPGKWTKRWEAVASRGRDWTNRVRQILEDEIQSSTTHRFLHFWVLVGKSFVANRCPGRAGALAFTSVLGLIPLLAVVISVSSGILQNQGREAIQQMTSRMVEYVAPHLEMVPETEEDVSGAQRVVDQITEFIANIESGTLGVGGMVALVLVAVSMISTIESTFNDIWGVQRGRSWLTRVVHFWSALTLGPLLLVMLLGLTTVPYVSNIQEWLENVPLIGKFVMPAFQFMLTIVLFALFYQFMPNTDVRWDAGLAGGIVGAFLWQLYNSSNALFVARVTREATIYGNFAVVPIFIVGVYFCWVILLFGAQVAYAYQNRQHYLQGKKAEAIHQRGRELAALRIMAVIGVRFQSGRPPPGVGDLCTDLTLPDQLVRHLTTRLIDAGLIQEIVGYESAFAPARPLERIHCAEVIDAIRCRIEQEQLALATVAHQIVAEEYNRFEGIEHEAAEAVTIADLVQKVLASEREADQEPVPDPSGPRERPESVH